MSWDVVISAAKTDPEAGDSAVQPLGEAEDVRKKISAALPDTDWSDPAWGTLEGSGWSIEFNTEATGSVESLMLHVRGEGDPLSAISRLCQSTGWYAFDTTTGEFLDSTSPDTSGWDDFRSFRDKIVLSSRSEARRSRLEINWPVVIVAVAIAVAITLFKLLRQS